MHVGMDSSPQPEPSPPRAAYPASIEAAEQSALMARTLALLFAAGASLSLMLFLVLPHPEANVPGMLATIGVTFAFTAWVIARGERIPPSTYPWLVALGTVLITVGIHFRGEPTAPHALFYLWIVFYSCYFLGRMTAVADSWHSRSPATAWYSRLPTRGPARLSSCGWSRPAGWSSRAR